MSTRFSAEEPTDRQARENRGDILPDANRSPGGALSPTQLLEVSTGSVWEAHWSVVVDGRIDYAAVSAIGPLGGVAYIVS